VYHHTELYLTRSGTSSQWSSVWRSWDRRGHTFLYRWAREPLHSTHAATCLSWHLAPRWKLHYSSQHGRSGMRGWVSLQNHCWVNAEYVGVDENSGKKKRWPWIHASRDWGRMRLQPPTPERADYIGRKVSASSCRQGKLPSYRNKQFFVPAQSNSVLLVFSFSRLADIQCFLNVHYVCVFLCITVFISCTIVIV